MQELRRETLYRYRFSRSNLDFLAFFLITNLISKLVQNCNFTTKRFTIQFINLILIQLLLHNVLLAWLNRVMSRLWQISSHYPLRFDTININVFDLFIKFLISELALISRDCVIMLRVLEEILHWVYLDQFFLKNFLLL